MANAGCGPCGAGQGLRRCAAANEEVNWSRLARLHRDCDSMRWGAVRCGPCGAFSGLQSLARREPSVFQSPGEVKPSLRQSWSSPTRSRLVQPSIPLAVRNLKSLNLAFFYLFIFYCCNGLFIFICCCCCDLGWFVGMILTELYFFFLWFGLLIILTIFVG